MGILDDLDDVGQAHLRDLVDQVKRGECVLFLGAGVSNEVGLPSGWELTATLAREVGVKPTTLSQVAQEYEKRFKRARLIQRVKQLIIDRPVKHKGVTSYDLIPEIDGLTRMVFTTNWDNQIENAFERKHIHCETVRYDRQIGLVSDEMHAVIKLHGDFGGNPNDIILTRNDYKRAYKKVTMPGGSLSLLSNKLATTTVLFVGYSLEDEDFGLLYKYIQRALGESLRMHYAVMLDASDELKKKWENQSVAILQVPARGLFEYIAHEVRDFVNRVNERKDVTGVNAKPINEVYGIAGNGKTELLKKIDDHYRLGGDWLRAFVNFEEKTDLTPLELAEELSHQTLNYSSKDPLQKAKDEVAAGKLGDDQVFARAGQLAATDLGKAWANRRVALLFDASEQMSDQIKYWIEKELFPILQTNLVDLNLRDQLRAVFAGRKPIAWETPILKQNLNRIALSPFSEMAVGEMLDWFAALKLSNSLPLDKRRRIVSDILDVTGGHPGCIKNILEDIARADFDVQANYVGMHEKKILQEMVFPVFEKEILSKVVCELHSVLTTVSVFRRLFPDFLDVLIEEGYLKNEYGTGLTLLGHLCGTYLVLRPRPPAQLYDIDPLVRHILALRMRLLEPKLFKKLNAMAMEIYDRAVMGRTVSNDLLPYPPSNELKITYIVEIMYHFLVQAISKNVSIKKIRLDVKKRIKKYLEAVRANASSNELTRLFDMLEARFGEDPEQTDRELLTLATKLFPNDGYHLFLEPIKEFRRRWLL